jgi:surfactin synthase thioesterase subunit
MTGTTSLLCIPFAGAGGGVYRPWRQLNLGPDTVIVPVQLPGREERFLESPCDDLDALVGECVEQVQKVADDGPFAIFGHSFGALLAYESTVRLLTRTRHRPVRLFVSGSGGPWAPRKRLGLAEAGDAEFVQRLSEHIGYEHPALGDPELRDLLLPVVRADLKVVDEYVPTRREPIPVPITVLRGRDDAMVTREQADEWKAIAAGEFERIDIDGGHMYFSEDPKPLLSEIGTCLARAGVRSVQVAGKVRV